MSYCRWSTDWFRCDVYCYEHVAGAFVTHVAARRHDLAIPPEWEEPCSVEGYIARREQFTAMRKRAVFRPIGLPFDGETFEDPDLPAMLVRLEHLRRHGYRIPEAVFTRIRAEIAASVQEDA